MLSKQTKITFHQNQQQPAVAGCESWHAIKITHYGHELDLSRGFVGTCFSVHIFHAKRIECWFLNFVLVNFGEWLWRRIVRHLQKCGSNEFTNKWIYNRLISISDDEHIDRSNKRHSKIYKLEQQTALLSQSNRVEAMSRMNDLKGSENQFKAKLMQRKCLNKMYTDLRRLQLENHCKYRPFCG